MKKFLRTLILTLTIVTIPLSSFAHEYKTTVKVDDLDSTNKKVITHTLAKTNLQVVPELTENAKAVLDAKELTIIDTVPRKNLIVVNMDRKSLTYYKSDGTMVKYPVALGKKNADKSIKTRAGRWSVYNKRSNPSWSGLGIAKPEKGGSPNNPLGARWLGYNGSYGIHGTKDPDSIGTFASLGCVRMYNEDVIELYKMVSVGTKVYIGTNEQLKQWGVVQKIAQPKGE